MAELIITIDGPAASGKSTAARLLAERLGASFLDTGAMYRAVTLAVMQAGCVRGSEENLLDVLKKNRFRFIAEKGKMAAYINEQDVTEQIRDSDVTANVRHIAAAPKVREKLVEMQREFAAGEKKIVTEGRDQGTVAFPRADIKFYITATPAERARRRQIEMQDKGDERPEKIQNAIEERDKSDESRAAGPLKPAEDAIVIDTTNLSIEEVVSRMSSAVCRQPKMRWFRFARWLCKCFCKIFFRISVQGKENIPKKGAFLLVSNHQSYLDPVFCGIPLKRPLYFLARDTLFANRFFGRLIASVNTIPVRRGKPDLSAIKKIIDKLKQGSGLCIFPEATRTKDGKIATLKPGFGLLCRRTEAIIVPTVIDGAFECWPRYKKIFAPGSRITICYGRPITPGQIKKTKDRELAKRLTTVMRRMQNDCRAEQGKKTYDYDTGHPAD